MSYILEALKKADQDRDIGTVPDLEATHEAARPKSRSYGWLWIVAPLLVVNGVLVAVLLTRQDADVPVAAVDQLEQQADVMENQPLQPAPRVAGNSPAPARSPRPAGSKPVIAAREPVAPQRHRLPPNTMTRPPPLEKPVTRAVAPAAAPDASEVPDWDRMSLEFRSEVNLPRLDVHVYSEDPKRRFILVNLAKYREGEKLKGGLMLDEILPDGIVLTHEGQRFRVDK